VTERRRNSSRGSRQKEARTFAGGFAAVRFAAAFALLLGAGCGYHATCPRVDRTTPPLPASGVYVKFLGVSGFLIQHGEHSVLTAPFYSNPTLGEVATQPVHTDHRLVDALLPDVAGVDVILSGHSHYDHLMDVPYIALTKATRARILGNDAMLRLLHSIDPSGGRMSSLEPKATGKSAASCPDDAAFEAPGLRIWPVLSEHSHQFRFRVPLLPDRLLPPVHLWRGTVLQDLPALPERPGDWVEGTTLAYLIDFLDPAGGVSFRVYYQDSGTRDPYGFPSRCLLDKHPVDLAILCVGGSETVKEHPAAIVSWLKPRFAIAAHWEDFFNPRELPLPPGSANPRGERFNGIPFASPKGFVRQLRRTLTTDDEYVLPCPDMWTRFTPRGTSWEIEESTQRWSRGHRRP
jgi:hypothetical protein